MAELASLWIGEKLGIVELASLRSFQRYGHQVTVYSPAKIALPGGVIWRPASEIMNTDRIILHRKTGSPALYSDLFRYALLKKTNNIWVDLDVVALRPLDFPSEWVFGYETDAEVNGAVLSLPNSSETLKRLCEFTLDTSGLPPGLKGGRKFKYWIRSWFDQLTIDKWPWGSIGPRALTAFLCETGEISHAMPRSAFYSIGLGEVRRFLEPNGLTRSDLPSDAWAVHLWGKQLRQLLDREYNGNVPKGSFLDAALNGEV